MQPGVDILSTFEAKIASLPRLSLAAADAPLLHALPEAYPGGCDITLSDDEYVIEAPIRLPSWVRIRGAAGRRPRLRQAPGSTRHILTNADHVGGNAGIVLEELDLLGNGDRSLGRPADAGTTWACGAYFRGTHSVIVRGLVCTDIRQSGLHFTGARNVAILGLRARDIGWSLVGTTGSSNVWIEAEGTRTGWDGGHSAIHVDGGTGITVLARLQDCTGQGVMIDSAAGPLRRCVVEGEVERCGRGVAIIGQATNRLEGVAVSGRFSNNRGEGVMISNARGITLVDIEAVGNGRSDLLLQGKLGAREVLAFRANFGEVQVTGASGDNWYSGHPLTGQAATRRRINTSAGEKPAPDWFA